MGDLIAMWTNTLLPISLLGLKVISIKVVGYRETLWLKTNVMIFAIFEIRLVNQTMSALLEYPFNDEERKEIDSPNKLTG